MQPTDTYYHIFNRGAHKAPIFSDGNDYERFVALLYIANSNKKLVFRLLKSNPFDAPRNETLVSIIAYCLMPNHFHICLAGSPERIRQFIQKLCTAYVMYYNKKYDHSGTIFQGPYKSKSVETDSYLATVIHYIHLNPYGIEEPAITKEAKFVKYTQAEAYSRKYEYSSYKDYLGEVRIQGVILYKASPCTN
jgi:REP element-mobilizing transposase RayT